MTLPSDKQLLSYEKATARINIWQGAVRSGKTFSSILKLIERLKDGPKGDVMIIGYTRESIQRNVLTELCNLIGAKIPATKNTEMRILGRQVYLVGANDERAVSRIQGSTLALAYVDEMTTIPQVFFKMLLSRLSVSGAQLLGTCNPEGPAHWLKKEFIDRVGDLDLKTWKFNLDDNPSLEDSYKDNLKKEYTGVWFKRYILGEWSVAQGLVYDGFDDNNIYDEESQYSNPDYYIAGLDYGTTNPTCCLIAGISPKRWPQIRIMDEYYYDSSKAGRSKTDYELADDIFNFISWRPINALYVDPAAASLKLELRRRNLNVVDGFNDVLTGLRIVNKFISGKNIIINKCCKNLVEEIQGYQWDVKAADKGIDKPLKEKDHACDALKYLVATNFKTGELHNPNEDISYQMRRQKAFGENSSLFGEMGIGTGGSYI